MEDYEQLYYDAQFEIKKLNKKISQLESDLEFLKKSSERKFNIRKEIIKELNDYYKSKEDK
jgi:hypothetical protein